MLFADASGFTRFAEHTAPEDVARALNQMFEGCVQTLLEHDGIVDKLMGDAVMAVFGAPIIRSDHAGQAVDAATMIQSRGRKIFPDTWKGARLRIGINSGTAFVGRVGSGDCTDYTAVGDTVNVAQRLQTEAQPGEILISDRVYEQLGEKYPTAERRVLQVKGHEEAVVAYTLKPK